MAETQGPLLTGLALGCFWAIAANVLAMLPSKKSHWPQAYGLIATGLPIVAMILVQNGVLAAILALLAAASILRWPLRYAGAWARRLVRNLRSKAER